MTKTQIASLGCKFLGIYALIQAVPLLGNAFQIVAFAEYKPSPSIMVIFASYGTFFLMALLGLALLLFSNKFAQKMAPPESSISSGDRPTAKDIQAIAFSVVGLVLIAHTIPSIFNIAWNIYAIKTAGDQRPVAELLSKEWGFRLAVAVKFIIGIILFFGAELLSTLWHVLIKRLRYERNITEG